MTQISDPISAIKAVEARAAEEIKAAQLKLAEAAQEEAARLAAKISALKEEHQAALNELDMKTRQELAEYFETLKQQTAQTQAALAQSARLAMPDLANEVARKITAR